MIMDANNFVGEELDPKNHAAVTKWMEAIQEMRPTVAMKCICMAASLIYRFASHDHITKEEFIDGVGKSIRRAMDFELVPVPGEKEINHK